jgi:hypothetical protein
MTRAKEKTSVRKTFAALGAMLLTGAPVIYWVGMISPDRPDSTILAVIMAVAAASLWAIPGLLLVALGVKRERPIVKRTVRSSRQPPRRRHR